MTITEQLELLQAIDEAKATANYIGTTRVTEAMVPAAISSLSAAIEILARATRMLAADAMPGDAP